MICCINHSLKGRLFPKCDWCSQCQWQGISSDVDFLHRISARRCIYFGQIICRLGRFSLWISCRRISARRRKPELVAIRQTKFLLSISAAEFAPDDMFISARRYVDFCWGFQPQNFRQTITIRNCLWLSPPFHRQHCLLCFWVVLTRWHVGCTAREWGSHDSHHAQEGCSPMMHEEFICHAEHHIQVGPPGTTGMNFCADLRVLPRLHLRCNRHRSEYVAMTVACVQVGRSVTIDCPCFVQAPGSRMLEV